jgi:putative transposase
MRISLAEKQRLMALACQKPEDFGIPVTQWNREMLAQVAQAQGIVKKISPRYVGKLLKNPPTTAP